MKILFEPVVEESDGSCFTVTGAINPNKEESVRITLRHSSFRNNPPAKIIRVNEYEVYANQ